MDKIDDVYRYVARQCTIKWGSGEESFYERNPFIKRVVRKVERLPHEAIPDAVEEELARYG